MSNSTERDIRLLESIYRAGSRKRMGRGSGNGLKCNALRSIEIFFRCVTAR